MKERLCSGPSHSQPALLPDTDKYFYTRKSGPKAGQRHSTCRLCRAWRDGIPLDESGLLSFTMLEPFIIEGVNRVGMAEFARRIGVTSRTIHIYMGRDTTKKKPNHIRKKQAKQIVLELVSMRRKEEVRHKQSIQRGSAKRGEAEKIPTKRMDYYKSHGDGDTELRRSARRREST